MPYKPFHSVSIPLLFGNVCFELFHIAFLYVLSTWLKWVSFYGVCVLRLCPSHWRGGLVYKGMDKGSFDDVTSFILRRHQINLCLSLLRYTYPPLLPPSPRPPSPLKGSLLLNTSAVGAIWYSMPSNLLKVMAFYLFIFLSVLILRCDIW